MRLTLEEVTLNNSNRKEFSHLNDFLDQEQKELIEYKTLEKELGIDLITLFKTLKDGAFIKLNDGRIIEGFSPTTQEFPVYIYFTVWGKDVNSDYDLDEKSVYTKDYGKTWALTREELL